MGVSRGPGEQNIRDFYSIKKRVNGQSALEVRQDGTEKSIDTSLRGSAPPMVKGATLPTVPHGKNVRAGGARGWRGIMLLA